jgi:hypothetical protein
VLEGKSEVVAFDKNPQNPSSAIVERRGQINEWQVNVVHNDESL